MAHIPIVLKVFMKPIIDEISENFIQNGVVDDEKAKE